MRSFAMAALYALIGTGAQAQQAPAESDLQWARRALHVDGWQYLASGAGAAAYTKPGASPAAAGHKFLQYRMEYRAPQGGSPSYHSSVSTQEADCAAHKMRTTKSVGYAANNLSGASVPMTFDKAWTQPASGTLGQLALSRACGTDHPF